LELPESLKSSIVSYFEGNLTPPQAEEILTWISHDKHNLIIFREMGNTWHASSLLNQSEFDSSKALKAIRQKISTGSARKPHEREIRLQVSSLYKVAAAVMLLVAIGATLMLTLKKTPSPSSTFYVETSAPKGSRSFITLPDSTTVWLNADTKFRYATDYGTTHRSVFLDGEAYFKVSKNRKLPFKVFTSGISVTALGTAFNVKAYTDEGFIETTLEEGSVRIDDLTKNNSKPIAPVILKPKQNAVFQKMNGEIAISKQDQSKPENSQTLKVLPVKVSNVPDTRPYTSWKDSRWVIKKEKLSSLVVKLERRYDVDFIFMDKVLEDYSFTGILLEESLEQVLAAIRYSAPIRYEINAKEVRLFEDRKIIDNYKGIRN